MEQWLPAVASGWAVASWPSWCGSWRGVLVRSAPSHGQSSGERCVGWAASPWSSKTGVYEDRLEEGETAAAMPSRQVVAAIGPPATPLPRHRGVSLRAATTARESLVRAETRVTGAPWNRPPPLSRVCVLLPELRKFIFYAGF